MAVGMLRWLSFEIFVMRHRVERLTEWMAEPLMQDLVAMERDSALNSLGLRCEADSTKDCAGCVRTLRITSRGGVLHCSC